MGGDKKNTYKLIRSFGLLINAMKIIKEDNMTENYFKQRYAIESITSDIIINNAYDEEAVFKLRAIF